MLLSRIYFHLVAVFATSTQNEKRLSFPNIKNQVETKKSDSQP